MTNSKRSVNIFFCLALATIYACSDENRKYLVYQQPPEPVFVSGKDGYACFRIPAIVQAPNGHLLAFSEGRKDGCSDTGNIDLVMKRSDDGGTTWGVIQLIWDDSSNTCGNPAPIVDLETGDIHLLSTWNLGTDHESHIIDQTSEDTRHVFVLQSSNGGIDWSRPREITDQTKLGEWSWYATGPGSGIQLQQGPKAGRLMAGCDHIEATSKKYFSHIILSDDHGETWQLGGTTPIDQVNECEVVELSDGRLMLNMRNYDRRQKYRQTAISEDGGLTWTQQQHTGLPEPICQASLQSYNYQNFSALLFSNPASQESRANMSVRVSFDDGLSWTDSVVLHAGPAAYSDLLVMNDGRIGCLFESGEDTPYEKIVYARIDLEDKN